MAESSPTSPARSDTKASLPSLSSPTLVEGSSSDNSANTARDISISFAKVGDAITEGGPGFLLSGLLRRTAGTAQACVSYVERMVTTDPLYSAGCIVTFSRGWVAGCTGPIFMAVQQHYELRSVAMLAIGTAMGHIIATPIVAFSLSKPGAGTANLIAVGGLLQLLCCAAIPIAPPFAVMILLYIGNALGNGLQAPCTDAYAAFAPSMESSAQRLSSIQSLWAFGDLLANVTAIPLAHSHRRFSFLHLTGMGAQVLSLSAFLTIVSPPWFRIPNTSADDNATIVMDDLRSTGSRTTEGSEGTVPTTPVPPQTSTIPLSQRAALLLQIFQIPAIWLLLFFWFGHTSVQSILGQWVVLQGETSESVKTLAHAFRGGIILSRLAFRYTHTIKWERNAVFMYLAATALMQLIILISKPLAVDFIASFFCGLFWGPLVPLSISVTSRSLPRNINLRITALSLCFAFNGVAGQLSPYTVDALHLKFGTTALPLLVVGVCMVLSFLWVLLPQPTQPTD